MRKLMTIIATLLMLPTLTAPAAAPAGYEYWFDNDISAAGTGSMPADGVELSPDVSALSPGVHYFNFRMNTEEGKWGAPFRKMFVTVANGSGAVSYEYWLDNDHAAKIGGELSDGSVSFPVDLTGTAPGMHYFNCRLYNNQNGWGAPFRKMIFTTGTLTDAVAYEYWIDDNYAAKESGAIAAGENSYTVDLTGIRKGMHRFNYRIQNGKGDWGSVYSDYFFYTKSRIPFSAYEYWFDHDYENRQSGTTATNPASFSVDLSGLDKSRVHYFNARVRDDDGDWGAIYRKMIVFYKEGQQVPLKGYRHSLNGVELGYEAITSPAADGQYTFTVDLPDAMQESLLDTMLANLKFEENRVSVEVQDSVHYRLQIETEVGWGVPQEYDVALGSGFADDITTMAIPSEISFAKPGSMEFKAVGFETDGRKLYLWGGCAAKMGIYRDGALVTLVEGDELAATKEVTLEAGKYVGIVYNPSKDGDATMTLRIMHTNNQMPAPVIDFAGGMVSMSCGWEGAEIYYTLDDSQPTTESTRYDEPFAVEQNCVVKAYAVLPGSDLAPSDVSEKVIDSFKVADPEISFSNLTVVITQDSKPGVKTYYTLDGKEPTEESMEYGAPFTVSGNVKIRARSFKDGYTPSGIAEFNYVHSVYVTAAPKITIEGSTVTITAGTEGSEIYYSIGGANAEDLKPYEGPFEMTGNGTIYAQGRKQGMYDSEIVSVEVNGKKMPAPQIAYTSGMVSISCANGNAEIYYTTDDSQPTTASTKYEAPFAFDRNGVIKAIAVDKTGNLDPSDIAEKVIDENKVADPEISFSNLTVVITQDSKPGVKTYYTLDGTEPTEESMEYGAPFTVSGNVKIRARSFKDGYTPSGIAEFNYVHNVYVTAAPKITIEGSTVTITAGTEGSEIYYSIGGANAEDLKPYEGPFEMTGNGIIYAQGRKQGMYDSEIVSVEVNGKKMPAPQISYTSGMVSISCANGNAEIYYTTDDSQPTEASTKYEAPFAFDRNGVIKAIAVDKTGNLDPSDIAEKVIDENKVADPEISFSNLTVVITQDSRAGVKTYYTLDGKEPTEESMEYGAPFTVSGNVKIRARSFKDGYTPSGIAEFNYVHSVYVTAAPEITVDGKTVTLTTATEGAQIFYGIDNPDTGAMTLYEGPFGIEGNGTIYAQARKEGMYDSAVSDYTIGDLKCALPSLAYNGRYVTLTNNEPDATLEYALGSMDNGWTEYDGAVDLGGMTEIFARVSKPGYNSSILSYKPAGYADEEHVETVADGIIPSLYDWADAETVGSIRALRVSGPVSGNDFIWLRSMEGLRHLDLTAAIADTIPDKALAGTSLLSVSMPAQMADYGEEVLTQNPGLAAIIWSSKDVEVTDRLLAGIDNPNLLLYLEEGVADYSGEKTLNIVKVNAAENVALLHGYPFHAPREFDAKEIVYTREFTKETELGGCAGWETMNVPFDVDRVESHGDLLEPFALTYRTGKPFWLYRPESTGWERTAEIRGYAPYLIAMPNHPWYDDNYIIRGEVAFSAANAHVATTPLDPEGVNWNGAHTMWTNFSRVEQSDDIWVINDETIDGNLPGSVFSRGLRDAEPFECYLTSYSAARHLPVFDASDVEEMLAELGTKIWTENGEICILSGISQRVRIHDTTGQLVRIAEVTAGEVCRVSDIAPGIYIIGHLKIKI